MPKGVPPRHGKEKANGIYRGARTVKESLSQAISASLGRLQSEQGGKNLAAHFDGREGREVAESTVSRWKSEPWRFPAVFVPTLCELDREFRAYVLRSLWVSDLVSIVAGDDAASADEMRRELESRFLDQIYGGPNRMGDYT